MAVIQNLQANLDAKKKQEEERQYLMELMANRKVASGRTLDETLSMPKNASESYGKYLGQYSSILGGGKNDTATIQKARTDAYYARNYIQSNMEAYDAEKGPGSSQTMLDYIDKTLSEMSSFEHRRLDKDIVEEVELNRQLYGKKRERREAKEKSVLQENPLSSLELPSGSAAPTLQTPYRGPARKPEQDQEAINMALSRLMGGGNGANAVPKYDRYREFDDFEAKSQEGASLENPNPSSFGQGFNLLGWKPFSQPVKNKVQYAKDNEAFLAMSAANGSSDPETGYLKYTFLNDEETEIYNYLLSSQGESSADRYLADMDEELSKREMEATVSGASQYATEHPIISNALTVAASPFTGKGYEKNAFAELTGGKANPYDQSLGLSRISGAIRGQTAENISDGWAGDTGAFLYQTGMSMADNLANMALYSGLGNWATLSSMGAGSAESSYINALERGATQKQALGVGALAGAAEILFEKLSLENLDKLIHGEVTGTFVKELLKQTGFEASEEFVTEIANTISDFAVMGELSNYSLSVQKYISEGKTEEEARKLANAEAAKNIGLAALGGGLSGGVMGAGGQAIGAYNKNREGNQQIESVLPETDTNPLAAGVVPEDDILRQAANKTVEMQERQDESAFSPDPAEQLEAFASTLDSEAAQAYRNNYEGNMDVDKYTDSFMSVYGAAKNGMDFEDSAAQANQPIGALATQAAYNAGEKAREAASQSSVEAVQGVSDISEQEGNPDFPTEGNAIGVTRKYTQQALRSLGGVKEQQAVRKQLRVIDALAKNYGFSVDVVDTLGDNNAQYDPKSKRITIALDAQEGAYVHMAVHELTHYIRDNNSAEWESLSDIVTDALITTGKNVDELVQFQMKKNGLDADAAIEEVVANTIPAILNDESVVRQIVQTDRNLAQRIADFFRDFFNKIKDIGAKLGQSESWKQMSWLENDGRTLREIADRFSAALEGAGQNSQSRQGQEDGHAVKYSQKNDYDAEIDASILKKFGKTYSWKETGYLMKDGTRLDFSGRNEGGPGGYRTVDHREVYGEHTREYTGELDGYSDSLIDFMARGNIRIMPESDGFSLSVTPTAKQEAALRRYIEQAHGEVLVDIDALNGDTLESIEYPRGTRSEKVITDIRRYFADGVTPVISDVARARALEYEEPAMKFSSKDLSVDDVQALKEENENYKKTIDLMQERYDLLKSEFKTTDGRQLRKKDVDQLAKRIVKRAQSSADITKAGENLMEVFNYLSEESPQWDQVAAMGTSWAKGVLEKSSAIDREAYNDMSSVRETLQGLRVSLSAPQKAEAKSAMGSDRVYRNALFGYVTVANDGMPLSSVWNELAEKHPHIFSADASEADMSMQLLDAVEASKPHYINPYEMSMDEAAYDLFMQAYDQYFQIPEIKTYADKQKAKMDLLRMQSRNAIARIREESKARYDRQLSALRRENIQKRQELSRKYNEAKAKNHKEDLAKYRERYRVLTNQKNQKLAEQRARFSEWRKMDSAKREERANVRKYRESIEKVVKQLATWISKPTDKKHVPDGLLESVGNFLKALNFDADTKHSENLKARLENMAGALARIGKAESAGFQIEADPDVIATLEGLYSQVKSTQSVYDMSAAQLKDLADVVSHVKHLVMTANKTFASNRYATISAAGDATVDYLKKRRDTIADKGLAQALNDFGNMEMLDSFYFAERLGEAGEAMFQAARDGADRRVGYLRDSREYTEKVLKGVDVKKLVRTKHRFQLSGGEIELTTAQIMDFYELNKREQARGHIYGGGINSDKKNAKVVRVTDTDVSQILGTLTDDQIKVADALQSYLEKNVAEWGNEASMEVYGYRKFTEKNYYPISSNKNFIETQDATAESTGAHRLKNLGMTKATTQGANNPIVLRNIFETYSNHVGEMANYNAYLAPSSDLWRWYNYKHRDSASGQVDTTIKREMERVFGGGAKAWFETFVKNINGGADGKYSESKILNWLQRNVKVAAVGANMRVVIQQPTAYVRAMAEIDGKYLLKGLMKKPQVGLAKKYCPIAQWKSWGYFETGLGKSLYTTLIGDQSVAEKLREWSTLPAGKADEITWGYLWNAVEAEVRDTRKDLTPGTEEFYQAVGKRLSRVIDRTQVVDTPFHRSHMMRSKSGLVQMTTSFMSEPTKTYNMVRSAIANAALNPKDAQAQKRLVRVSATYVFGAVLTAAAASVIDAFRSDDDDKEWTERYLEAFGESARGNLNFLQNVPILKDFLSMLDGYQSSRLDMQGLQRLADVLEQWPKIWSGTSKWSLYRTVYEHVRAISDISGIPAGALMREMNTAYRAVTGNSIPMESETAYLTTASENIYEATISGDEKRRQRTREKLQTQEKPKSNAEIDRAVATVMMESDPRIAEAYEARKEGDIKTLREIRNAVMETGAGFSGETFDSALNQFQSAVEKVDEEKDIEKGLKAKLFQTKDAVEAARKAGKTGKYSDLDDVMSELIADSEANDPEKSVKTNVQKELKAEYISAYSSGDWETAGYLEKVLADRFDVTEDDLDDWVHDDQRSRLVSAIDGGDTYSADLAMLDMIDRGETEEEIAKSLKTTYKKRILDKYDDGDDEGVEAIIETLTSLSLGKKGFSESEIRKWIKDHLKKEQ